jgi:hypothetical protein
LAIRRGPENAITDAGFIEALRRNASLFLEPQTRVLTKTGTEIPCGGSSQPIYRNLNGRWIMTSPILHIATIPVDGVELTKECEEVKLDDDGKFDFMYGGVYDDAAIWEPWNRATPSSSWRTLSGRSGASGRTSLKDMEDQPR